MNNNQASAPDQQAFEELLSDALRPCCWGSARESTAGLPTFHILADDRPVRRPDVVEATRAIRGRVDELLKATVGIQWWLGAIGTPGVFEINILEPQPCSFRILFQVDVHLPMLAAIREAGGMGLVIGGDHPDVEDWVPDFTVSLSSLESLDVAVRSEANKPPEDTIQRSKAYEAELNALRGGGSLGRNI